MQSHRLAVGEPLRAARDVTHPPPRPRRRRFRVTPYVFLSPSFVLLGFFAFAPLVVSIYLSFQNTTLLTGGHFVGGANYATMVHQPEFWTSLKNTLIFTIGTVPTSMALGLVLAVLLNRRLPGVGLLRSLYFLPVVVSGVAVSMIMGWIFNGDYGIVDNLMIELGLKPIAWLDQPQWAMFTLVVAVLWGRLGFCMIVYLAALQSIPATLMEASKLDGAGAWSRFCYVTFPLLRPTTFLLLVLNVVYSLQAFDIIYVLTGGGPGFATTVFIEYIFNVAFTDGKTALASAMGVVFMLILVVFTYTRYRAQPKEEKLL
jgi:multiple sugar transport system permease protein